MKRAIAAFLLSGLLAVCAVAGAFWLRTDTLSTTKGQVCRAIRINNDILKDLIVHVEMRSIRSIEEGVTKDITPEQVLLFYQPTLHRLSHGKC